MFDLTAIGEILIDFDRMRAEDGSFCYKPNPGGAPANVASALAKLGHKCAFVGKVGRDQFGEICRDALSGAGVDTTGLLTSETAPTTLAFVHLSPDGNRDFSFYRHGMADVSLTYEEIPQNLLRESRLFHFGSVSMTEEPARSATMEAARSAKKNGLLVSFDPNLRPPLWKSLETARREILSMIPLADILKISEEEAEFLYGPGDCQKRALELSERHGIPLVLISRGRAGCAAAVNGRTYSSPAFDLRTIDTTGSGDSFLAGVLHHVLESECRVDRITPDGAVRMLDYANAVGSLVTTRKGAIPALPAEAEILRCIQTEPRLIVRS